MTLTLARDAYDQVVAHARDGAPEEVCGVLGGTTGEDARVTAVRRVTNVADSPRARYELDPGEQLRAMEELEDGGLEVVGFYHSHPEGPPRPSGVDERLATWEGYAYVVVSLAGGDRPDVGCWRYRGEAGFEAEPVRVENGS